MQQAALVVIHRLRDAGHEALLAGGCVRDILLGRNPHDYDVATSAKPEEVQALFPRTVAVGAQFGVIVVMVQTIEIQVATFRSDGAYIDGRHPEGVVFTDARGDALRRDFTINGLFFDPIEGKVLDFVGGCADLENKVLAAIGDAEARLQEDKLRLLRAVRFAAVLQFQIEKKTWLSIIDHAKEIHAVSGERIREEIGKILLSSHRLQGFDLLDQSGLLAEIFPEVEAMKGCEQPPEFHPEGDVFIHTRLMLSLLPPVVSLPVVLGVLFHDIGKPATGICDETGRWRFNGHERVSAQMTVPIMQKLRYSNSVTDDTLELVRNHMAFKDVKAMREAKLKRFLARPTFDEELELHRVDCLGSHGLLDNYDFLLEKQKEFANEPLIPPPLITGKDLIVQGRRPGPLFRIILENVQTLQLEGNLTSHEAAIAWVNEHFPCLEKDELCTSS